MAEGESKSDDKRAEDEMHGRIQREPWLVVFFRKLRRPLMYGSPQQSISDREFYENAPLEDTPEEEKRQLDLEKAQGIVKEFPEKH